MPFRSFWTQEAAIRKRPLITLTYASAAAAVLFALCAGAPLASRAGERAPWRIATFNAEWLWDKPTHKRWVAACSAVNWNAATATRAQVKALAGLPYCDVHNGLKYPPQFRCPALTRQEINTRPLLQDKGCRESKDLVDWAAYEEKRQAIRGMVARLAADGITLIAFQEVFNTQSLREILPAGWDARTSADIPGAPKTPLHLGVAWKIGAHRPGNWDIERGLADIGERSLRPGFLFTDFWNGKPVQFLVVHLKAGCPSPGTPISAPRFAHEKDTCPVLEQQAHVLEKWIDSRVGADFVIIGDFNRRLTFEKEHAPGTGKRPDPMIDQLFPELNDNDPRGSELQLARPERVPGRKGRKRQSKPCPNGYPAIDHIIISRSLSQRAHLGPLQAHPIIVDDKTPFKPGVRPFKAPASDHCPHFVELQSR